MCCAHQPREDPYAPEKATSLAPDGSRPLQLAPKVPWNTPDPQAALWAAEVLYSFRLEDGTIQIGVERADALQQAIADALHQALGATADHPIPHRGDRKQAG
jgi:hypothetical protein